MPKINMRSNIILFFTALIIIPILIVCFWVSLSAFKIFKTHLEKQQETEIKKIASVISAYFSEKDQYLNILCDLYEFYDFNEEKRSEFFNYLLKKDSSIHEFVAFDLNGETLFHFASESDKNIPSLNKDWSGKYFLNKVYDHDVYYDNIYFHGSKYLPYLIIATPIFNDKEATIHGVGITKISLTKLTALLDNLELQDNTEVLIIDADKRVIAQNQASRNRFGLRGMLYKSELQDGVIFDYNDRRVFFKKLNMNLATQEFTIVTKIDFWQTFGNPVKVLAKLLFPFVLCLLGALLFFFLINKKLIIVFQTFSEVIFAVKNGNLNKRLDLKKIPQEALELAENSNEVISNLAKISQKLEDEKNKKEKLKTALKIKESQYDDLVQNSPLGVATLNIYGQVVNLNSKGIEILELKNSEQTTDVFFDEIVGFFQPKTYESPFAKSNFKNPLNLSKHVFELSYQSKNLKIPKELRYHINLSHNFTDLENKSTEKYQVIIEDISKSKQMEDHFRQSQKLEALGTLTGGIVHDFNNVLSAIIGYTELALNEDKNQLSTTVHHLEQVLSAGQRAKELVQQILSFSRRSAHEVKTVFLSSLIQEVLKMMRPTLPSTLWINTEIEEGLAPVLADSSQLHQVILNLCTNAAFAMKSKGGVLTLKLFTVIADGELIKKNEDFKLNNKYQCFMVEDTGFGMAEEVLNRVFEPFYTTKEAGEGTGMGLSVAQSVVKSHGGLISADSVVGKGSVFSVYLPEITDEVQNEKEKEAAVDAKTVLIGQETILFVDDEPALVDIATRALSSLGYNVVGETDSRKALERFKKEPSLFDILITDQTMPYMTGTDLSMEVFAIIPDFPVIVCTGFTQENFLATAYELGIHKVILKPLVIRDLVKLIRAIFDNK